STSFQNPRPSRRGFCFARTHLAENPTMAYSRASDNSRRGVRRMSNRKYRIAVIPGDGIGKEVIPEGQRAAEAVAGRHGFSIEWEAFDWSCERYAETGRMMPEDGIAQMKEFDAIYLGAVGFPGVPDHVSLWGHAGK